MATARAFSAFIIWVLLSLVAMNVSVMLAAESLQHAQVSSAASDESLRHAALVVQGALFVLAAIVLHPISYGLGRWVARLWVTASRRKTSSQPPISESAASTIPEQLNHRRFGIFCFGGAAAATLVVGKIGESAFRLSPHPFENYLAGVALLLGIAVGSFAVWVRRQG